MNMYPTIGTPYLPTVVLLKGTVTVTGHLRVGTMYDVIDREDLHELTLEEPEVIYWDGVDVAFGNLRVDAFYIIGGAHLRLLGSHEIGTRSYLGLGDVNTRKSPCSIIAEKAWWIAYSTLLHFKPRQVSI